MEQTFVFFSRSSLSLFRLPPLPASCIPLPTILQIVLLVVLSLESAYGILETLAGSNAIWGCGILIAFEGISGGLAYVNVFYRLARDDDSGEVEEGGGGDGNEKRRLSEREFKIASVGFADTLGILAASGVASLLEPYLCQIQVNRGKTLCREI